MVFYGGSRGFLMVFYGGSMIIMVLILNLSDFNLPYGQNTAPTPPRTPPKRDPSATNASILKID